MSWTNITPVEYAAEVLIKEMIRIEQFREVAEATGAPLEGANAGHVSDELFEAWLWLCGKEPLPFDAEPKNSFANWSWMKGLQR